MEDLLKDILECLRSGVTVDDVKIASLCRAHNAGVTDVKRHLSKKKILPFYLRVRENDVKRWEFWNISPELESQLLGVLKAKPRRTASGVATITVITKPYPCGNNCLYCPSDMRMPKSYLYDEPACRRAERNYFDPYLQVASRLFTLEQMGHITDKIELIVLGGTWTDYPSEYRIWYINQLFAALNDSQEERFKKVIQLRELYGSSGIECDEAPLESLVSQAQSRVDEGITTYNDEWPALYGSHTPWGNVAAWQTASMDEVRAQHKINENAAHRVVGLVVETRPETLDIPMLTQLRSLGCTKVQVGVQTLNPVIMRCNDRPTDIQAVNRAFVLLRAFGFKIHAHFMANLKGVTPQSDKEEYRTFVTDGRYCPDEVKMYPCALIKGSRLCREYEAGEWQPYSEEELMDVLVANTLATPAYTRISRMIRDFSADDIVAGVKKTNLRQMVESSIKENAFAVEEIRFREIGTGQLGDQLRLEDVTYQTSCSEEHFLQWVDEAGKITGFLRLSLPDAGAITQYGELPEPLGCAMIREVHVYGRVAAIDKAGEAAQHRGLGKQLIQRACDIAKDRGYTQINVISAVGTRGYYRDRGFEDNGLYQTRDLVE